MRIVGVLWSPAVVDKLAWKHNVGPEEVEQVFLGRPKFRKLQKGQVPGEDLFAACAQTDAGRYLIVFFIFKADRHAFILSARDMDHKERRRFEHG